MNKPVHFLTLLSIAILITLNIFIRMPLVIRILNPLALAVVFCFLNILFTGSNISKLISLNAFGTVVTALCAGLAVLTGQLFLMDICIAWAIQSFVVTIIFSKLIAGKGIEE